MICAKTGILEFDRIAFREALRNLAGRDHGFLPELGHIETAGKIDWKSPEVIVEIDKLLEATNAVLDKCLDTTLAPAASAGRGGR